MYAIQRSISSEGKRAVTVGRARTVRMAGAALVEESLFASVLDADISVGILSLSPEDGRGEGGEGDEGDDDDGVNGGPVDCDSESAMGRGRMTREGRKKERKIRGRGGEKDRNRGEGKGGKVCIYNI
jgi:hypothetical protein